MLHSLEFTVSEQLGSLQFSLEHSLAYTAKTSLKELSSEHLWAISRLE